MKIVTWNCNGALRNKFKNLLDLGADICIIQECEDPNQTNHIDYKNWANNYLWKGDNKNKGLGIFAFGDIKIQIINWSDQYEERIVKHFLPCMINNDFQLLGLWACHNDSPNFRYIGQIWKYLQVNKSNFKKIIIAGDFNSNSIWDECDRWWNHSDVVRELEELEIVSLYHKFYKEKQGEETKATFFLYRRSDRPYHIDYIFANKEISNKLLNFEIAPQEKWIVLSDHLPISCEFRKINN